MGCRTAAVACGPVPLTISTVNVNGIRAAVKHRSEANRGLLPWLDAFALATPHADERQECEEAGMQVRAEAEVRGVGRERQIIPCGDVAFTAAGLHRPGLGLTDRLVARPAGVGGEPVTG